MSLETLFAPTTREAPFPPMRETFIAPTMLPICCVCRLIRDETGSSPNRERWVSPQTYRQTHGVNPADFPFTHTYCETCFTKAQETVTQYFRENRNVAAIHLADSPGIDAFPIKQQTETCTTRRRFRLVDAVCAAADCWPSAIWRPWNWTSQAHR